MVDIVQVELPDGRIIEVEGTNDPEAARSRVRSFLQEERRNAPRTGSALESGFQNFRGSIGSAIEGAGTATGIEPIREYGQRMREAGEAGAEQALPQSQRQSFEEAETLGDYTRAAGQALGQSAPGSAASMLGTLSGAAVGARIGAAGGPIGMGSGAILGGLLASYPQLFGSNRQRQMQERPGAPVNEGAAALAAVPQAAVEGVADRLTLGLASAFGRTATEVGRTLVPRLLRGLGVGAATEVPEEVIQQALERAQAGLDVLSPDAFREYREAAIGAAVAGGTMGAGISGTFGRRPNTTLAPAPTPGETPGVESDILSRRVAEPLPEEPEPFTTVEEAQQFLAANPQYAVPSGVSDEGLLVRANDALRSLYRDQVSTVRQQTLNDFIGASDIITRPGELNPDGTPSADVTDYSRAGHILVRNILNAQGAGTLEDGAFTANDVADLALTRLGFGANSLTRAERTALQNTLNSMASQGILERTGKRYRIAERTTPTSRAPMRPGEAPRTTEEAAAQPLVERLSEFETNPTQANAQAVLSMAANTQLAPLATEYVSLTQQGRQLQAARRDIPTNNPESVQLLQQIDAGLRVIATRQGQIVDELQGRARGQLRGPDTRTGQQPSPAGYVRGEIPENEAAGDQQFSTQVGLSQPNIPPGYAETNQRLREQQAAAAQQANQARQQSADIRQFFETLRSRPAEARTFLQNLAAGRQPGQRFDATNITEAAIAQGYPITPQDAVALYNAARELGVVNRLGVIPPATSTPATPVPAAAPAAAPAATPAATPAAAPAATTPRAMSPSEVVAAINRRRARPTVMQQEQTTEADPHDSPAFMESADTDADARYGDDREADVAFAAPLQGDRLQNLQLASQENKTGIDGQPYTAYIFTADFASGGRLRFVVVYDPATQTAQFLTATAQNVDSNPHRYTTAGSVPGATIDDLDTGVRVGTKEIRQALRTIWNTIKTNHPDVRNFTTDRVTGARANAQTGDINVDASRVRFAALTHLRVRPETLPGFDLDPSGAFDYTVELDLPSGSGVVNISGRIEGDALIVQTARATNHVRGEGYGVRAYRNLVDWAHSNGLDFKSDSMVSDAAGNVYAALERRGYEVERLPGSERYRSGNSWVAEDGESSIYTLPAPYKTAFAFPGQNILSSLTDAEIRQQGETAFRRVLGQNGRLDIRDNLFLRDLDKIVQDAAATAGISLDTTVSGFAHKDLAVLSLAAAKQGGVEFPITQAAIHEGWHVAENLGIFTPNEIAIINANLGHIAAVVKKYIPSAQIETRPPHEIRAYGINARIVERADFGSLINRIFDRFTNFLERIGNFMRGRGFQSWRDVYDAFESGGMADRQGQLQPRIAAAPDIQFAALPLTGKPGDRATVERATTDQIRGALRWFGSPIMTMGKIKPELRAASDVQRTLYTRANEMINETENMIVDAHKLPPASVARITRAWETASRTRKAPNLTGFSEAEKRALAGEMASVQRALDYFIEASALNQFMPTADKSPVVRARLEAFWQRHGDKHLWEIPQRELMAASPEGYREMQKYERIRNPYYMPMIGRGTHFVAAYKKGPGGARGELVGMVPYNPLNVMQRFRGFSDPEADAKAQLAREFDPTKHIITERGRQFTQDAEAAKLRDEGDFIAKYLTRLADVSKDNKAAMRLMREMTTQIDKAQMERIFRPNRDILRAVTPANESSYILDVIPQYLLSMSKVQARRYTQPAFVDATKSLSVGDQQFLEELRDYTTTPTEAFGNARAAAFFMYLGGAFDTAVVNLTQNFNTYAMLARDGGGKGTATFLDVLKTLTFNPDVGKLISGDQSFSRAVAEKVLKSPDENAAVKRALDQGIFAPVFTNESRGHFTVQRFNQMGFKNAQSAANIGNRLSNYAGRFMQMVEEYNRLGAFLSAYRLAKSDPSVITRANHIDGTDFKDAYSYAVGKVIDTQYLTTKEDRAYIQRFHPAAEVATQFMSYPIKTVEQYARHWATFVEGIKTSDPVLAKAGALTLIRMMAPLVALAGVWALPFAESGRELLERVIGAIWGSTQNFDADLREMLGGGKFAEATLRGIPHAQDWFSLSHRLAINPVPGGDLFDMSTLALFGPVGGLVEAVPRAAQYAQNGDYWQMAATLMPRAAGNVVKGMQLGIEGEQYTRRGNRVITPEDVERVDSRRLLPASVRQALGFPPPEFVNMREMVSRAEEVQRQTRSATERINKELAGYLVDMMDAQRRGEADTGARAVQNFNRRVLEILQEQEGRPLDRRINLNMQSIQRRALDDFYGISSEQAMLRRGRRDARPEIQRQREMLDWRNQTN